MLLYWVKELWLLILVLGFALVLMIGGIYYFFAVEAPTARANCEKIGARAISTKYQWFCVKPDGSVWVAGDNNP
jgi:hypothetical protein